MGGRGGGKMPTFYAQFWHAPARRGVEGGWGGGTIGFITEYIPFNIPSFKNQSETLNILYKSFYIPLYSLLKGPV